MFRPSEGEVFSILFNGILQLLWLVHYLVFGCLPKFETFDGRPKICQSSPLEMVGPILRCGRQEVVPYASVCQVFETNASHYILDV